MPRSRWSGDRRLAEHHGATGGNKVDPAPRRPVSRWRRAAKVVAGSSVGGPRSFFGRRRLKRTAKGSSRETLRPLFSAFAVYASRWLVMRPRLSSPVEAVRATPRLFPRSVRDGRCPRASSWLDLAEGRLRLDRLCRNGVRATFFPWAGHPTAQAPPGPRPAHSSRGKKAARSPSFAALRAYGCVVDRLRP